MVTIQNKLRYLDESSKWYLCNAKYICVFTQLLIYLQLIWIIIVRPESVAEVKLKTVNECTSVYLNHTMVTITTPRLNLNWQSVEVNPVSMLIRTTKFESRLLYSVIRPVCRHILTYYWYITYNTNAISEHHFHYFHMLSVSLLDSGNLILML